MKIKLILALFLICLNLNGRNSIDSLNILLVNTKSNVQKVDLYNQIGILKSDSSKFDGLMYFEQANILANKLNYRKGVVYSIYNSANVYYKYDFDSLAILFYESSLPFFVHYKDTLIFIEINRRLEFLYYRNFEYSKAILIDYKLLDYYKKQNNISKVIGCYISIGNFNLYKNKYFDAQENYWLALKLAMKYKIDSLISLSYGNIGLIHSLNGDFKVANDYFFKVLTVDRNLQNQNNYLIDLINIAKNYNASGDSILSLSYFEQSRIIAEKLNAKQELSVILQETSKLNFDKQKYKEAIIDLKSSIEINKSIKNYLGLGYGYFLIVRTMIHLNQNKKEIFKYLQQGMYFANKANDLELNDNGYNANIEYYEWVGNEKEALKYYKLLVDNKELLSSKSKLKDISKLDVKFLMGLESEKKTKRN
jgi:tetratricopeptide (TPR) repeat protein